MDEAALIKKLIKIESLFSGAATQGERNSADLAKRRIMQRLQEIILKNPSTEHKFTFSDINSRNIFAALLKRYNLKPYRYKGQRHTTIMVKVPELFVSETLWPEFQKLDEELNAFCRVKCQFK